MKPGVRRLLTACLLSVIMLACAVFTIFKVVTRWQPDEQWATEVISESKQLRLLLERYYEKNGEFPKSLSSIRGDYAKPTDYLDRKGIPPGNSRWFYERIGKDDYQLFVCARSWVSFFDAMVYRHTGIFADPWHSSLDPSDYRIFGDWRYVRGFSRFNEKYYFDEAGDIHSNFP